MCINAWEGNSNSQLENWNRGEARGPVNVKIDYPQAHQIHHSSEKNINTAGFK